MKINRTNGKQHLKLVALFLVFSMFFSVAVGLISEDTQKVEAAGYTPKASWTNDKHMIDMMNADLNERLNASDATAWEKRLIRQWQETESTFRWTENPPVYNGWKWNGSAATGSGNPKTVATAKPTSYSSGGWTCWDIYSVEQLRYVLEEIVKMGKAGTYAAKQKVLIKRDLDFNGMEQNWVGISAGIEQLSVTGPIWGVGSVIIQGDHEDGGKTVTLYNFGSSGISNAEAQTYTGKTANDPWKTSIEEGSMAGFIASCADWRFLNLTFRTAKIVGRGGEVGMIGKNTNLPSTNAAANDTDKALYSSYMENVHCIDSIIFGGLCTTNPNNRPTQSRFFTPAVAFISAYHTNLYNNNVGFRTLSMDVGDFTITKCSMQNVNTFGGDHVGTMTSLVDYTTVENSFSVDCTVVSTGEHSGGFIACAEDYLRVDNCFTNNEVYGNKMTGVFIGVVRGNTSFTNSYTSGTVEGTESIGGFIGQVETAYGPHEFTNCYSTSIAGMQNGGKSIGGFAGKILNPTAAVTFTNCYAAGEVGDADTDVSPGRTVKETGGFFGRITANSVQVAFNNCYYDKQTTGMREWIAAGRTTYDGSMGIKGLLTSKTNKSGKGLTSYTASDYLSGFTTANWYYYATTEIGYPMLMRHSNEAYTTADFGALYAKLVMSHAYASTMTIRLNTWETDRNGNPLDPEVYDTVRDIVGDFVLPLYRRDDCAWNTDGTQVTLYGESRDILTLVDDAGGRHLRTASIKPGLEWVTATNTSGSYVGSRRIRVIVTRSISVGSSEKRNIGETYDHADSARFAGTDAVRVTQDPPEITEGIYPNGLSVSDWTEDQKAVQGTVYPSNFAANQGKFRGVKMNHMYPASTPSGQISDVNVHIYRMDDDPGDEIDTSPSKEIPIDSDPAWQDKFNGKTKFTADDVGRYLIVYYWDIYDGRHLTDMKIFYIKSDEPTVTLQVMEEDGNNPSVTPADKGVEIDTYKKGNVPALKDIASDGNTAAYTAQYQQDQVVVAFRALSHQVELKSLQLTMTAHPDSKSPAVTTLNNDQTLTVPDYHYRIVTTEDGKFYVQEEKVNRTYTLKKDSGGLYTLSFELDGTDTDTGIVYKDVEDDWLVTLVIDSSGYQDAFILSVATPPDPKYTGLDKDDAELSSNTLGHVKIDSAPAAATYDEAEISIGDTSAHKVYWQPVDSLTYVRQISITVGDDAPKRVFLSDNGKVYDYEDRSALFKVGGQEVTWSGNTITFPRIDESLHVNISFYEVVRLHIRQVALLPANKLDHLFVPATGYLRIQNNSLNSDGTFKGKGTVYNSGMPSGTDVSSVGYTQVDIVWKNGYDAFDLQPILPMNFRLHPTEKIWISDNQNYQPKENTKSYVTALMGQKEWWVTVYLEPSNPEWETPYARDETKNDLGKIRIE